MKYLINIVHDVKIILYSMNKIDNRMMLFYFTALSYFNPIDIKISFPISIFQDKRSIYVSNLIQAVKI